MDEQFDNKLTDRIREVFENYEHPPADEGWMKLREKFPAQQSRNKVAWLWWGSAAAVLLVFLGVGLWVNKPGTPANNLTAKPVKHVAKDTIAVPSNIAQNNTPLPNNNIAALGADKINTDVSPSAAGKIQHGLKPMAAFEPAGINNAVVLTKNNVIQTPAVTYADSQQVVTGNAPQQIAATQTAKTNATQPVIGTQPVAVDRTTSIAAAKQPAKTITQLMQDEKQLQPSKKDTRSKQNDSKVNFSVYAATYFNYAEGSSNQINAGAGFTSDIKLTNNLKISTGVSLAQNTLSYNNTPPAANGGVLLAAAPKIKQESLFAVTSALPEFRNYSANLVGLDIPINIKYEFNPQKSDTYISAGLSSGTFIDERYTYTYGYGGSNSAAIENTTENETSTKSFNSFYFGKTLNVAFGVGVPVGKNNRLIFEPFLKYPLGGLGAQQINFGAGGLNLKFNFKGAKK
jgi:hypothetical protein